MADGAAGASIVVGIDGSYGARLAALRAVAIFGPDADYRLVAVCPPDGLKSERRSLKRGLERTAKLLGDQGVTATTAERDGDPAEELIAAAGEAQASLVVVGSRGAEMFMPGSDDASRIGAVALALLNRRSCEVLVVHNPDATPRPAL
jgi:nucleotide-binding universal stress UspA family protein